MYTLSICIPTHNRAGFLKKNLNFLAKMVTQEIELVIGNDGSTDNTKEVVEDFAKENPKIHLKYIDFKKRVYFDGNVMEIVKSANGKFCWLLGDDDLPKKDSIKKIKSIIAEYPNLSLIHLNYSCYDNMLHKVVVKRMVREIKKDILFKKASDFYFKETKTSYFKFLGTNTITMCTDIINRRKWLHEFGGVKKFVGHNFIHSFLIGKTINSPNSVYFVAKPMVQYLSNNSGVWPNSIWEDYNKVLLKYLATLGYPKTELIKMKKSNTEYIKKESFMKNRYLKYIFMMLKPVYYRLKNMRLIF